MPTEKGKEAKKPVAKRIEASEEAVLALTEAKPKPEAVLREEEVLSFWKEKKIFEKSLEATKKGKPYIFYEGPPTANAAPAFHHMISRFFKDIVPRFKTMQGFHVPRRGGWDTHGLPVELQVEKALGFKTKQEIDAYGIAAFNEKCRESVWQFVQEWRRFTDRIAFWLDMDSSYITYERTYMESLWWIIAEFWKKKLLYQDFKVLPWCTRCGTGLSSHELALGYKSIVDSSVYIRFKLTSQDPKWKNVAILSWTTTPWTLPGNVALAVSEAMQYVRVPDPEKKGNWVVVGQENFPLLLKSGVLPKDAKASVPFPGKELTGLTYQPLFEVPELVSHASYKIYGADFVTGGEGTGVVHTAVMYGEDDYRLGKRVGLPAIHTVTENGRFIQGLGNGLGGKYVKSKDTELLLLQHLQRIGSLFREEAYEHEYPFCWRCDTPILYYARSSWWVRVNQVRKELLKNNETINWVPSHLKHGRFGEWLKEEKDWAFSRERYWGTTLPLWRCSACGDTIAISSLDELASRVMASGNRYIVMRHGESESVVGKFVSSWPEKMEVHLTEKGKKEVDEAADELVKEKINLVYSSDLLRTRETVEVLEKKLNGVAVHYDKQLREIDTGIFNGGSDDTYSRQFKNFDEKLNKAPEGGESLADVRARVAAWFTKVEKEHRAKTILVVTHADTAWMLLATMKGHSVEDLKRSKDDPNADYLRPGTYEVCEPRRLPLNLRGEVDLHRPYVDQMKIRCACGGVKVRVSEVADVWFDSGSMPFAQNHYPFENADFIEKKKMYPADYISEAVDQTRGWFYTMLAVGTLLGKGAPYKNVISLGHILDKNGQKMSKSRGNVVNPWEMIEKYGVDAIRWYMYTVNAPGEAKKFDEKDILGKLRGFLGTLWNSYILFETYTEGKVKTRQSSSSLLDRWILSRLHTIVESVTTALEAYDIVTAARVLESFVVDDFSNWYLRRSRRRFQRPETKREGGEVTSVAAEVLVTLTALVAPFVPYVSETMYQGLKKKVALKEESIHLRPWPKAVRSLIRLDLETRMGAVRRIAAEALRQRATAGVKVRQPLAQVKIKSKELERQKELLSLVTEEVNVKAVTFMKEGKQGAVQLDTVVTEPLKREGMAREIIRNIQEMRRDLQLKPKQEIEIQAVALPKLNSILEEWAKQIKRDVNAKSLKFGGKKKFRIEREIPFGSERLWLGIR